MRDALLRSGYLLESRVENRLREHWGYVEANASYQDPETGKSRELDVYSMAVAKAGPEDYDFINMRIESHPDEIARWGRGSNYR